MKEGGGQYGERDFTIANFCVYNQADFEEHCTLRRF